MPYSSVELSAADLASMAADKPMLLGKNWLRDSGIGLSWRQGGSWAAGADETDANGPVTRSYDDYDHLQTYPATAQTTWYLLLDLGTSAPGIVDSLVLPNPNNLIGVQTDIQIADDNAYTSNLITVATQTPTTTKRLVFLDLDHTAANPRRYSDVRWMRLKFTKASTFIPVLGEVFVSRRRQLKDTPREGWERNNLRSDVADFVSYTGIRTRYAHNKGQRIISPTLLMHQTAYIDDFETFWETDIDRGVFPFFWIELPNTSPSDANWMYMDPPILSGPASGFTERTFSFSAKEQGPNYLKLGI